MRYSKYIEPLLSILVFTFFFIYLFRVDQVSTISIIILLVTDFLMKIGFRIYSGRLRSRGKIVLIRQKESNWRKIFSSLFLVVTTFLVIHTLTGSESPLEDKIGVILPLYIGLASFFVSNKSGDFYIDKLGIIQPELLKRNYDWNDIHNFKLNDNSLEFKVGDRGYSFYISDKTIQELKELKIPGNVKTP